MKNSKKGISLIVLVITIIVIIILAAAVILTLNQSGITDKATEAVLQNDRSEVSAAITLYIAQYMMNNNAASPFNKEITGGEADFITISGTTLTDRTDLTGAARNVLSWADLGLTGAPASMKNYDAKFNIGTGVLGIYEKGTDTLVAPKE